MKVNEILLEKKSELQVLMTNRKQLTPEEREQCMKAKAVWHHGPNGKETPAVWKGTDSKGKMWYVCNTHRCWSKAGTLKGAINKYHTVVKDTA